MAHSDVRLLSLPHRVHFAGWVATLPRLQQAGWQLSAEQDFMSLGVRIAGRHADWQMKFITNAADYRFFDVGRPAYEIDFQIAHIARELFVEFVHGDVGAFRPFDAMTQMTSIERKEIDDFGIFATPLARTEEIIVEPETVMQLLEKIKAMQSPEQAAIRERNRSRERRLDQPIERQQFHAQILSIAA